MVGLILVGFSAILRTAVEGTGWIRRMLPVNRIFAAIYWRDEMAHPKP
jgi:hypothetical protein